MHMVRENVKGDLGGSTKTRNDNKAGYKQHDDGNKKYGKNGKKKEAEQKARSAWHS